MELGGCGYYGDIWWSMGFSMAKGVGCFAALGEGF